MASHLRQAVPATYLLLCLLLGGSSHGIWRNAFLQLAGLAILAWIAARGSHRTLSRPVRRLLLITIALLAVCALQLLPLPPGLWAELGGREKLAVGYDTLGLARPWLPLSVRPYDTVATVLQLIPPLALFCAVAHWDGDRPTWLAFAVLAGTISGILLGVLQVSSGDATWYLDTHSNFGAAVGFFANANHMGALLVTSLAFVAALFASTKGAKMQQRAGTVAALTGTVLVILVGVALNRSLAAYLLAPPVIIGCILVVAPVRRPAVRWAIATFGMLLAGAGAVLAFSPVADRALGFSTSLDSRAGFASVTIEAVKDFMPFGSGLGSFRQVYRLYEDHENIDAVHVNHAHNDYLELALELGIPGIILIALFLIWWVAAVRAVWRFGDGGPFARAATIASGAILVHSVADYPLRTSGLSGLFAVCLALMVHRRRKTIDGSSELWPTRHLALK